MNQDPAAPYRLGSGLSAAWDQQARALAEAEDRALAAERELELLTEVLVTVLERPLVDEHQWSWARGGVYIFSNEQVELLRRLDEEPGQRDR